jgi:hypothetical protein
MKKVLQLTLLLLGLGLLWWGCIKLIGTLQYNVPMPDAYLMVMHACGTRYPEYHCGIVRSQSSGHEEVMLAIHKVNDPEKQKEIQEWLAKFLTDNQSPVTMRLAFFEEMTSKLLYSVEVKANHIEK